MVLCFCSVSISRLKARIVSNFGHPSAFGLTSYTAGLIGVIAEFKVSMVVAILGFTIYICLSDMAVLSSTLLQFQ